MPVSARACELNEIAKLRDQYRAEMNCQIIHDSIHHRAGWSREFALDSDGAIAGYGSVAVAGPWKNAHALYEFFVEEGSRKQTFDLFEALLAVCNASIIETQTNDPALMTMLGTFGTNLRTEAILFDDRFETQLQPEGARFRASEAADVNALKQFELDDGAKWLVTVNGQVAGSGDILYHYNRPYGDVYMTIAEPFRKRGLGSYLVQELKRVCREGGSVPAARCNIANVASRKTLQKAGFVPCGNLIVGDLVR